MTITVQGNTINDIEHQLGIRAEPGWISIENLYGVSDYGREYDPKKDGYKIRWKGSKESFTQIIHSTPELLSVLRKILAKRDAGIITRKRKLAEEAKKALKKKVTSE